MRGEMNSNRYEISFRLKISLRCLVSSLLVFPWIEAKWNSKRYGFHIFWFWPKRNFKPAWDFPVNVIYPKRSESAQTRWTVRLKLNAGIDFISVILTEMKFSFRVIKYRVNTTRNEIPTYPSEYRVILKCSRNETSCEQNLFSRQFEIANRYEFISPLIWASKKII